MRSVGLARVVVTGIAVGAVAVLAGCTEPGETTGMGAAAGSAIGAGVGAIIGSQTGDAGAGLALGAVAGAGTGALIANSLEAQEKAIRNQEEALERQEQTIQAQRREINELRGGVSDNDRIGSGSRSGNSATGYSRGTDSLSSSRQLSQNEERIRQAYARAKPLRESNLIGGSTDTYDRSVGRPAERSLDRSVDRSVAARGSATRGSASYTGGSASYNGAANGSIAAPAAGVVEESLGSSDEVAQAAPAADLADRYGAELQPSSLKVSSSECREAEEEVKKSESSMESADKLFHLRRALRLCPSNPSYHNQLGELYLSLNRKDDAEYEFKEALALNPAYAMAEQNLARVRR